MSCSWSIDLSNEKIRGANNYNINKSRPTNKNKGHETDKTGSVGMYI